MTTPKRIVRRAPQRAPVAASPSPPKPAPTPQRVIPIKANGALPKREESGQREGGSGVDYPAVIKRYKDKVGNRTSAIRAHCIECSGGMISEVRNCAVTKCALYPFRNGDDPFRKKRTDGFVGRNKNDNQEEGEEE